MKRIWLVLGLSLVLAGTVVACGSSDDSRKATATPAARGTASAPAATTPALAAAGAASYTLTGFADHTAPGNFAPPDATATGGTLKSCNPQSLYAFLNFSNVTPPKQFAGSWTLNGTALNTQTFTQTANNGTSFFQVQNTPQPLEAGAYRFQLVVDNNVVTQGTFTLAC